MIDLHIHSSASDGGLAPEAVVERARAAGLAAISLTDHDTVAGVAAAVAAGERLGVRVVSGCEFSTAAPWGEMHVLAYFLPTDSAPLEAFLERCRADRVRRARAMVDRLQGMGVSLEFDDVLRQARGGAVGRPHVARAIVRGGGAAGMSEAFDRYIGRGRPAFVEKVLPTFAEVADLVHSVRGIVSLAHLKDRGTQAFLERLKGQGLDAIETRHPSHDPDTRARLTDIALGLGLLRTGGSDWHGDPEPGETHGALGSQEVPLEWLERLDQHRLCEVP
jgi:predicted metal-dependent phosphoesterase TrpH